jgi:hypothetical protein
MPMKYVLPLVIFASPAWAICNAGEETFMSCQIAGSAKFLEVCFDDKHATYSFGKAGQVPELTLQTTLAALDYRPWNATGTAIVEEVVFYNKNYAYAVRVGYERPWGEELYEDVPHRNFGGVTAFRGDRIILDMDCDRASVEFTWDVLLFEAKEALGLTWDDRALKWVALPD